MIVVDDGQGGDQERPRPSSLSRTLVGAANICIMHAEPIFGTAGRRNEFHSGEPVQRLEPVDRGAKICGVLFLELGGALLSVWAIKL